MVQIGRINRLIIKRTRDYGLHLEGGAFGDIVLRGKYDPEKCRPGEEVEVFVYPDREDHLCATTLKPYATVGQFARLRVVANSASGSYLYWGLEKDLFVPKSEQQEPMAEGKSYLVFIFLNEKNNRIAASAKLAKFFDTQPPDYEEGQEVDLIIYEKNALGFGALINQAHGGMLYENEVFQRLALGQELKGYIKKIRDDRKIDLTLQKPGLQGVDEVALAILETIKEHGGSIAVTDKSRPQDIYSLFGVSKKTFKKAIGSLYKKRLITIDAAGIRIGNG
jgi:predicted RNA-binding protein (virulence factor B family)